jgi:hypothetical protein
MLNFHLFCVHFFFRMDFWPHNHCDCYYVFVWIIGIWTLCVNLNDDEIKQLRTKGFPSVDHCFNYLSGNADSSRNNDELRADWQHSEFQPSLHPHLSRYNNNVFEPSCPDHITEKVWCYLLTMGLCLWTRIFNFNAYMHFLLNF